MKEKKDVNIEVEQAKKLAYERFNEKVFLLNSAGRPKTKKKIDILKIINKVENKNKKKKRNKSKQKSKFRSQGGSPFNVSERENVEMVNFRKF